MTKKICHINVFGILCLLLIMAAAIPSEKPPQSLDSQHKAVDFSNVYLGPKTGNPKIESSLSKLNFIFWSSGKNAMTAYAQRWNIDMEQGSVRVVVEVQSPAGREDRNSARSERRLSPRGTRKASDLQLIPTKIIKSQVVEIGGKVEISRGRLIQALLPVTEIETLAASPFVRYIRLPRKFITTDQTSEGVSLTRADEWQAISPYRSVTEVKVCVLDAGFTGYQSLLGTELPTDVVTMSFRSDADLETEDHGTACAEIVHDMAPDAELYLVNFETDVEFLEAVDWIIQNDIDIVTFSLVGVGTATDGTGLYCKAVREAAESGIVWVTAAGNQAASHWEGTFSDPDTNGYHNFDGDDEYIHWWVPAYHIVYAVLTWDDWGTWDGETYSGSDQDYDLELYGSYDGINWALLDSSYNWQTGSQLPFEAVGPGYSSEDLYFAVRILGWAATRNVNFELYVGGNPDDAPIEYNVPESSLLSPADSSYAISVGATDCIGDWCHFYSSQGPTNDGRMKPDLTAPSGVSGATYGTRNFFGTSASTPHVAGAIALLLDKLPFDIAQVEDLLENRALDLGPAGKDAKFGTGRLRLKESSGDDDWPVIDMSPTSLSFSGTQGLPNPNPQYFQIRNSGPDRLYYQVTTNQTWLTATPWCGDSEGEWDTIQVAVDIRGLAPGNHSGLITVCSDKAENSPQTVSVDLSIDPGEWAAIELSTDALSFSGVVGQSNPDSQNFQVRNSNPGELLYEITANQSWLSVSPTGGDSSGEWDTIQVLVDTAGLTEGSYVGLITVSSDNAGNSPQTISVSLNMSETILPQPGEWSAPTDFGTLAFTVNPESTHISSVEFIFNGWLGRSGSITVSTNPGWPITNGIFEIEFDLGIWPDSEPWTVTGTFAESGDQASGTWQAVIGGSTYSGTWTGTPTGQ